VAFETIYFLFLCYKINNSLSGMRPAQAL